MFHIVDDYDLMREIVADILDSLGYHSKSFECPQAYIDYVKSDAYERPIAVFTDVSMPVMTGYEMLNIASKLVEGLKFVVMTGEPEITSEHMDKPCMYLSKPFKPEMIANIVDKLVACHNTEPSCNLGCNQVDDRAMFSLKNWSCPHADKSCC